MKRGDITSVERIAAPRRHVDPSPTGEPFVPKPVAAARGPRMSGKVGENRVVVPEGAVLQCRRRDVPGGPWSDYTALQGAEFEFRIGPPLKLKRAPYVPGT